MEGLNIEGNCFYCNKYSKIFKYDDKYYCSKHYTQLRRHGKILNKTRLDKNDIIEYNTYFEIVLRDKNLKDVGHALISNDQKEKILKYKWRYDKKGYVITTIKKGKNIFLHRLILNILDNPEIKVDHINHNKLDNRNENIRLCTQSQNLMNTRLRDENTSGVIGVVWDKTRNKWRAQIRINGKVTNLGRYNNFEEAVKVRKNAEIKYHKEFAPYKGGKIND